MNDVHWHIRLSRIVLWTVSWSVMGFLLAALPVSVMAQWRETGDRPTRILAELDDEDISSLSVAQRAARQLALILMGEQKTVTGKAASWNSSGLER